MTIVTNKEETDVLSCFGHCEEQIYVTQKLFLLSSLHTIPKNIEISFHAIPLCSAALIKNEI